MGKGSHRGARWAVAIGVGWLAFAPPGPGAVVQAAPAEAAPTKAADQARALELFQQSEALYKEGRFQEAAALLEEAYALHPEPLLLYNLARARDGEGKLVAAADAYEAYLRDAPEAADRGAIEKRIRTLRQRVQERARLEQESQEAQERLEQVERERQAQTADEPDDGDSVLAGPLPWVVVGVGAAGAGVGLILGLVAQSQHDEAMEEPVQTEAASLQAGAEDLATGANIALIAGGTVALVGAVLGIVGLASSPSDKASTPAQAGWQLRLGPGYLGIDARF